MDSSQEINCCGNSYTIQNSFSRLVHSKELKKVVTGDALELANSHEH